MADEKLDGVMELESAIRQASAREADIPNNSIMPHRSHYHQGIGFALSPADRKQFHRCFVDTATNRLCGQTDGSS